MNHIIIERTADINYMWNVSFHVRDKMCQKFNKIDQKYKMRWFVLIADEFV